MRILAWATALAAVMVAGCKSDLSPAGESDSGDGTDAGTAASTATGTDPTTDGSTASATAGTSGATTSSSGTGASTATAGTGTSGTATGGSTGGGCAEGADGCSCAAAFTCDAGLFCVADLCTPDDPFETLVMGIAAPEGLAVDGDRLFYAVGTQGARQIRQYDLLTGVDSLVTQGHDRINGLAARGGQVYFTQAAGDLTRIDADNLQDVEVLAIANPRTVAVGPTHVAVGQVEPTLLLMEVGNLQSQASIPINQASGPMDSLYVTATHVFGGTATENSDSTVHQMAIGDANMVWIHNQPYWVTGVAAVTTNVYWASMGWPPDNGEVLRKPVAGGGESLVVAGNTLIGALATDGASVFWTEPGDITAGDPGMVGAILRHTPGVGTGAIVEGRWLPAMVRAGADAVFWINVGDGVDASLERRLK